MALKKKVKRAQKKSARRAPASSGNSIYKRIKIVLVSLIVSLIVFAFAWIGYNYLFLESLTLGNFFFILSYVSGFLAIAFFIALLILMILRAFRK